MQCYRLMWICERAGWPNLICDLSKHKSVLDCLVTSAKEILERIEGLPFEALPEAHIDLVVSEAIRTSFIEGQDLDRTPAHASVRHLAGLLKATATRDLQLLGSLEAIKPLSGAGRNTSHELNLPTRDQFLIVL